ncbi:MAG: hypothetical protein ACLRVN_00605 [Butyricicoccus sp.]
MNLLSGRAYIGETDLNLTQKEFAALLYLARHPNRSVSAQSCTRRSGSSRWEPTRMPCA